MIFYRKNMPERELILHSGEKIMIRQLSPAERLYCLHLPGDKAFCKRLQLGIVKPRISFRKAKKMLNETPFQALEILRAVQSFSKEKDISEENKRFQKQDERFLNTLQFLESLKKNEYTGTSL